MIKILENNPVQPDLVVERPIAEAMNRTSIAHLSIERAMKFLISEAGGPAVQKHDLSLLLNKLRQQEPTSAKFLDEAFKEAVQHYRYNPNVPRMKHIQSLERYLKATGSGKNFQDIRYWELSQSIDEILVGQIYPALHLEILRAVWELLIRPGESKETVSLRVEIEVQDAMLPQNLAYAPGTDREHSVKSYLIWLREFETYREAIRNGVRESAALPDDEFIRETIKEAHEKLRSSKDTAVKYFAEILTVLPKQNRDPKPCVEWLGSEKYWKGVISTPGGADLGLISRRLDGFWDIRPSRNGPGNIAENQTDARCFMANLLTSSARATVNGKEKSLRVVGAKSDPFCRFPGPLPEWDEETNSYQWSTYEIEFWNKEHGILEEDNVKLEVPNNDIVYVLKGKVTQISDQKVSIFGIYSIHSSKP